MIPQFIKDGLKKFEDLIFGTGTVLSLSFPEETQKHFQKIQAKTGAESTVDLFRLSLTLYDCTFDALKKGHSITINETSFTITSKDGSESESFDLSTIYPSLKV